MRGLSHILVRIMLNQANGVPSPNGVWAIVLAELFHSSISNPISRVRTQMVDVLPVPAHLVNKKMHWKYHQSLSTIKDIAVENRKTNPIILKNTRWSGICQWRNDPCSFLRLVFSFVSFYTASRMGIKAAA